MITNNILVCNPTVQVDKTEDFAIAKFIRFLRRIDLKKSLADHFRS